MTADAPPAGLRGVLDEASVVVCCGSGGVGKTTVAAAFGVEAARRGRRVVVLTIDPAKRLADALGVDELGPEPSRIDLDGIVDDDDSGELWAMMLDTGAAFNAVVRRYAADPEQADRIVANAFFRNMVGSLSGTQEYMAAETLHLLARDDRFDLVVVDTPPTRSALDFLAAPGVLARFLDHRLFKLLMLPARPGMRMFNVATQPVLRAIGRVVGSDVLADAVAFFQAFAGMESGFRQRADDVMALLRVPSTVFLLVAAPRREAVAEASWFAGQLAEQGIEHVAGVVNRVHPQFGAGNAADASAAAATAGGEQRTLWDNLAELRTRRESELATLDEFLTLLAESVCVEVPQLASDVHDRGGLIHVGQHLFGEGA
jgi:anion-transporting  ArsA/GET3 family ATPase